MIVFDIIKVIQISLNIVNFGILNEILFDQIFKRHSFIDEF